MTPDSHYRKLLPITDAAVVNGVFLTPLNQRETVAVIATVLIENLIQKGRYQDALAVSDIILKQYPNFAYAMVKKGTAAYHLLKSEFYSKYPKASDVPQDQRRYLVYLQRVNKNSFDLAENLGWRPIEQ